MGAEAGYEVKQGFKIDKTRTVVFVIIGAVLFGYSGYTTNQTKKNAAIGALFGASIGFLVDVLAQKRESVKKVVK